MSIYSSRDDSDTPPGAEGDGVVDMDPQSQRVLDALELRLSEIGMDFEEYDPEE